MIRKLATPPTDPQTGYGAADPQTGHDPPLIRKLATAPLTRKLAIPPLRGTGPNLQAQYVAIVLDDLEEKGLVEDRAPVSGAFSSRGPRFSMRWSAHVAVMRRYA